MLSALLVAAALAGASSQTCYNFPREARYDVMNDHEILVSAGLRAYRVTVAPNPTLSLPSTNLVVEHAGAICSPLDLRLSAAGPSIGRAGIIVQSIERLPSDVAEELRKGQSKASQFRR